MSKHPKYKVTNGVCQRCGAYAVLCPDPKAPRFGKARNYVRIEDRIYCQDCAANIEAGLKRIRKKQEQDAKDARRHFEKVRLEKGLPRHNDSRTKSGFKKRKYDL
jgi:uncharacterized NAD-dependent epimerase/dehydratase family protein